MFDFRKALEKLIEGVTTEEMIKNFLPLVVASLEIQKVNVKDIDAIQFSIRRENEDSIPIIYGLYASYTLKSDKDEKTFYQLHCINNLKYPEASLILQLIEKDLNGYNYYRNEHIYHIDNYIAEEYKIRELILFKI